MKLKEALSGELSAQELAGLVRGYDVVGDIAITIIPPELQSKEDIIGAAILKINKNIKVVAKRSGNYGGELRTIALQVIAGENRLDTEHRENGVRFFLHPAAVYFSVRSAGERQRLAALVHAEEDILVMFSGIGALPLILARHSPAASIVGIEKNNVAHNYAVKNLDANKKIKNVSFLAGDVDEIMPNLKTKFNRIAMPLPKSAENFLGLALAALECGGWLHFYDFQAKADFAASLVKIKTACAAYGRNLSRAETHVCGHVSPKVYRLCVDACLD